MSEWVVVVLSCQAAGAERCSIERPVSHQMGITAGREGGEQPAIRFIPRLLFIISRAHNGTGRVILQPKHIEDSFR